MTQQPNMFDTVAEVDGVRVEVDPIDRPRSDQDDNVMAIFAEEQPITWRFAKPYVYSTRINAVGELDFLDVGCGSGIFGLLFAKRYGGRVLAIDKSPRTVAFARANAARNGLKITVREELYSLTTCQEGSVSAIGLNPPYHLYPSEIADCIPQHARGGPDGQDEFKNQLLIAGRHIVPQGIIFFNMMCLGRQGRPEFLAYIPRFVGSQVSIWYTNVFPPMATSEFLARVYGDRFAEYRHATSASYPSLHYAVGVIVNDSRACVEELLFDASHLGRSWEDRIELHRQIALHALR